MMKPLKITFNLVSPVIVPGGGLWHLDGLLAFCAVQESLLSLQGRQPGSLQGRQPGSLQGRQPGMPGATTKSYADLHSWLDQVVSKSDDARHPAGMVKIFMASCITLEGIDPAHQGSQAMLTRRTEVDGMAEAKQNFDRHAHDLNNNDLHHGGAMLASQRKNGDFISLRGDQIDTTKGDWRNHLFFLPTVMAERAVAYCIGDPDKIRRLLDKHISAIGSKTGVGYGAVGSMTVEIDEAAWQRWKYRSLPWPEQGYVQIDGRVAPPYWDQSRRNLSEVWIPAKL